MSASLVPFVTSGLELLDAAIADPPALGGEVADARAVFLKAPRLTRDVVVANPEVAPGSEGRGSAALAVRDLCDALGGEPKMAARRYKPSRVSAVRTIVGPPTAGRSAR